jgi:hypothetical protein
MDKYYVYGHYKTGEPNIPFYIGKGYGRRAYDKNHTRHWHNVVNKHGYEIRFLAEGLSETDAFWLEKQLIGMFGRADLGRGPLVNMTDGGEGASPSEETRRKIGDASAKGHRSPEHIESIRRTHSGKMVSEETRRKLSDSAKETWRKRKAV